MQTINSQIQHIDELIESAEEGKLEEYRQQKQKLEEERAALNKSFNQKKKDVDLQSTVQNVTALAGSVATLTSVIQQFQNLGNIWNNKDLTDG